jgi:hypothetical protein
MRTTGAILSGLVGVGLGVAATALYFGQPRPVGAAAVDRYQDYVMATGAVTVKPGVQTDGVWMLDYRSGKLLGTVIDRYQGKIVGWAEVDLTKQFEVPRLQDVHFMMTTGYITQGQSALYVAETNTGKFGVFTMGPGQNGSGVVIRQHDMTTFRQVVNPTGGPPLPPPAKGGAPAIAPGALSPAPAGAPPLAPGAPVPVPGAGGN